MVQCAVLINNGKNDLNRLLERAQLPRLLVNIWLLKRLLERVLPLSLLVDQAWKSPTDSDPALLLSVKLGNTRSQLNYWSGNSLSRDSLGKLPVSIRLNCASKAALCWLFRRLPRLTWFPSSRTQTFAPFTPEESPLWVVTSSWPSASEVTGSDYENIISFFHNI